MKTKFDIDEEVYVKAKVVSIAIDHADSIEYRLTFCGDNRDIDLYYNEDEIFKIAGKETN